MFAQLKKLVKDCTTENNGQSYDFVRVIVCLCAATGWPTFLGCAVYSVVRSEGHHFDMVAFGTGFCAILAGMATAAAGIAMKQKTDTL